MPRHPRVAFVTAAMFGLIPGCGGSPVPVPKPTSFIHPDPGCSLYKGAVSGNDYEMNVRLILCPHEAGLTGMIQYESDVSGWSIRKVVGRVGADGVLSLHDTEFVVSKPSEEWRYCLVDEYRLRFVDRDAVEGTYLSAECNDSADVVLRRAL